MLHRRHRVLRKSGAVLHELTGASPRSRGVGFIAAATGDAEFPFEWG